MAADGSGIMQNEATFRPDAAANARAYRDALGSYPTGVTVITAIGTDGLPLGITANSFASASLDPPLVLWSPGKASSRYAHFMAAGAFAIHVLDAAQQDLCQRFARAGAGFGGLPDLRNAEGVPLIPGTLARFDCVTEARHDAGDHTIILGRVLRVAHRPGAALCFAGGRYTQPA